MYILTFEGELDNLYWAIARVARAATLNLFRKLRTFGLLSAKAGTNSV